MPRVTGRSYRVGAASALFAQMVAREMARLEGHRCPTGRILWTEDLGPDPAGRAYEVVIEEPPMGRRRALERDA